MKTLVILAVFAVAATLFLSYSGSNSEFDQFVATYQKSYNSADEYELRKSIFESNLKMIAEHNAGSHSYTLEINQFGDLTLEEFKKRLGYKRTRPQPVIENNGQTVPKSDVTIDWEAKGVVSPVKNQGSCGSCWAFSAVGALEAAHAIAGNGQVQEFAEQQLVDCDTSKCQGCNGGEMFYAFAFYQENGACFEKSYPYKARDQKCQQASCTNDSKKISNFVLIEKNDPSLLHENLQIAPHSLGVEAGNSVWQFYKKGVVDDARRCGSDLDHGVLLAGYDADLDAWKVKNSWGPNWGVKGYIYIKDNHKVSPGVCGVNMEISRPVL